MIKYIDAEKLIAEIERLDDEYRTLRVSGTTQQAKETDLVVHILHGLSNFIASLQQEQSNNMIQWTGNNLKEVIDFTGKTPRFGERFNSWDEYEKYVHTHNDILKLFCEDGSHYEVPVGAWIVKTPDGYNVPSVARFIYAKQWQPEVDENFFFDEILKVYDDNNKYPPRSEEELTMLETVACHFYLLGLNARKE